MKRHNTKGTLKNDIKMIIVLIMIIASASMAYAFACFCDGYVFNSDGSIVLAGIPVNVTNLNNLDSDSTTTENDFPPVPAYQNRYKTTFDCNAGADQILVSAYNSTHIGQSVVTIPSSAQAYVNITLTDLIGLEMNTTPGYKHIKKNETTTYDVYLINNQGSPDNFTLSLDADIHVAQLSNTQILNLPGGSTTSVTLTVNDTDGGSYTSQITAVSDNNADINDTAFALTEVNENPTISGPADSPDPILPGNSIRLSATATDINNLRDTSKIIACTSNNPPINGQCNGGTSLCDYFDAPITASSSGVEIFCYHNITESNGTTVTYYLAAVDSLNETSSFTSAQKYYVGVPPSTPPPTGGGGGSSPPPEEPEEDLCSDGIQNQGETGVDCGGPCSACPPTCSDGIWNQGEFSIDCGGPCAPCETCFDGIQNQDETGIDCGGKCSECETCNDGIQNQGEAGTDCGGPCPVCPTCEDGIQNQDETGIDCGGTCLPCPPPETCNDGEQNGGEEDVDCGGPCPPCDVVLEPEEEEEKPEQVAAEVSIHDVVDCQNKANVKKETINDLYEYSVFGLDEENYALPMKIPKSYVLATAPFNTDCPKESFNISIAVPDDIGDIKVLRCRGNKCRAVNAATTEDPCKLNVNLADTETRTYDPKTSEKKKTEKVLTTLTGTVKRIKTDDYELNFDGESSDLNVSVSAPEEPIDYPENEYVKIVGTPIVLNVSRTDGEESETKEMEVTLPYTLGEGDDPESVALYARTIEDGKPRWHFIGGEVDMVLRLIKAKVDLKEYEQNGTTLIAPMTVNCEDCKNTGFVNAFTPSPDTKRAVILIHGLFGTYRVWDNFINTYKTTNQPYQLWTFNYLVSKSIKENAKELAQYLETNSFRYNKVDVVGYSLGGLVTQEALRFAYDENQKNPNRYTFINKMDKAILVATPNDGSPVATEFEKYLTDYINEDATDYVPINPLTRKILKEGISVEQVPGIEYLVIAGTKPFTFMQSTGMGKKLFGEEQNDGLVAVSSAQHIGNAVLDQKCVNFWSREQDHTHMIIERNTQNLIAQMLSTKVKQALSESDRTTPLAGYTDYYEFAIDKCSPEDVYVIIGKQAEQKDIQRDLLCGCGDGVCAGFENAANCPTDCTEIPPTAWASLITIIIILLFPMYIRFKDYLLIFVRKVKKELAKGKSIKEIKKELEGFGYHKSILGYVEKVENLKDYDDYKIRDLIGLELSKEDKKKFSGFVVVWNGLRKSVKEKPGKGKEALEMKKATEALVKKEKKGEEKEEGKIQEKNEEKIKGVKEEATEKKEETVEEKKEDVEDKKKESKKKKDEPKPPKTPLSPKEEMKATPKKNVKKTIKKVFGKKSPEDLMKELEDVDKDLVKAKEENESIGFEAIF